MICSVFWLFVSQYVRFVRADGFYIVICITHSQKVSIAKTKKGMKPKFPKKRMKYSSFFIVYHRCFEKYWRRKRKITWLYRKKCSMYIYCPFGGDIRRDYVDKYSVVSTAGWWCRCTFVSHCWLCLRWVYKTFSRWERSSRELNASPKGLEGVLFLWDIFLTF